MSQYSTLVPSLIFDFQNRYRELMRVFRQWQNLELWKRAGFSYSDKEPGPGELVEFCTACPQDGYNLRRNWQDDPNQYVNNLNSKFDD